MIKRQAYTLIELLVVIAIILMLTVFGLPMFNKYQHVTEFNQKTEEVKELFNSAQAMALSPETTSIYSYRINYDKTTTNKHKYLLVSCLDSGCTGANIKTLSTVPLLSGEAIQIPAGPNTGMILECRTVMVNGRAMACTTNPPIVFPATTAIFTFGDTNNSVDRLAKFTLTNDPFRLDIVTLDL
ncbi:MAG TPA: type II secretion system protein [Patescibacteria group bacterium]|nr:type II secretion system protein [Patescibacteria group bacterium]